MFWLIFKIMYNDFRFFSDKILKLNAHKTFLKPENHEIKYV